MSIDRQDFEPNHLYRISTVPKTREAKRLFLLSLPAYPDIICTISRKGYFAAGERTVSDPAIDPEAPPFTLLLPRSGYEFIQCSNDLLAFLAKRSHNIAELLDWDGDYFERMQDYRRTLYFECRVETRMT
jgi:hypothetical protein